jgi:hypothetical protein
LRTSTLLGHDLDLKDFTKTNAWEISAYAKDKMIQNLFLKNTDVAEKKYNTTKEVVDNSYMQAHNLLLRMTVNAMGKSVQKNKSDIVTVALILTYATEGDKEAFRSISKDCGVTTKPSLP